MKSQSQYPRKVCVTFFNKSEEVARLTVGAEYTVYIDVESREYNGKWYVELKAWRVTRRDEGAAPAVMQNAPSGNQWQTVAQAQAAGLQICTLGRRILRCETAPLCALSAVMYASGEF